MPNYNIAEAKSHFSELVQKALTGEEVIIARDNKPLLRLMPLSAEKPMRTPGSGKGKIRYIAPDFDATPADFNGYIS